MIVRRFLEWVRTASAEERAEGASALARAFLYSDLDDADQHAAEAALTCLVEDASPLVRRALAEAFASAVDAPHHCVAVLANDQSDIAAIVLARSPVLSDGELIDCATVGDAFAQGAIAVRAALSASVSAALAEVGAREALIALAVNESADLPEFSMRRMLERFGHDGEMREALLERGGLPAAMRAELVAATARALSAFVTGRDWLSEERATRLAREAAEKATVIIAADVADATGNGPLALVRHLRRSGQLTAGLVLRALLSGNRCLFDAALAELSGLEYRRVTGLVDGWRGAAFPALYQRAGLPESLLPAFRAALAAHEEFGAALDAEADARLSRAMVERVISACERLNSTELSKFMALLRRFEAEAAAEEARRFVAEIEADARRPRPDRAPAAPAVIEAELDVAA